MRKSDKIAICGFLIILCVLCTWCIDVSVSAMINDGMLYNGTFFASPALMYHIALYVLIFIVFLMFLVTVHAIVKDDKK